MRPPSSYTSRRNVVLRSMAAAAADAPHHPRKLLHARLWLTCSLPTGRQPMTQASLYNAMKRGDTTVS